MKINLILSLQDYFQNIEITFSVSFKIFLFYFFETVSSLYSLDWPGVHYIDQASLVLIQVLYSLCFMRYKSSSPCFLSAGIKSISTTMPSFLVSLKLIYMLFLGGGGCFCFKNYNSAVLQFWSFVFFFMVI